ncbi:CypD family RiPP peptide-cysteine decarboxylase [Streptomyces sp. DSM 42041]|uniref:CypD family RiPP peptide-cysteine decarboxylase n=1 Tax=Streptomyces hazeniae TaxID=3075538 RepID=A0ABU2NRB0_9ACTN|nr:CypD family RiPP peptide-cysteine decarboxylase [Streptomyces sp. DSM 42041]MDT0379531.1 CypD family RiPP peptide-cysteine decarboxylase [Streptomyces sp. DSM 42041]
MNVDRFEGDELHLHVTGSISAALVPWWVHLLRTLQADLTINVSVTQSAKRFLTVRSLQHLVDGHVWTDSWDEPGLPEEVNSGKSGNSACFILFPATLDTLMRLAQGRADSPALLMLQVTDRPIVIADTLPGSNEIVEGHLRALRSRHNIQFAPRVTGVRASSRSTAEVGFNLPGAIAVANQMMKKGHPHE